MFLTHVSDTFSFSPHVLVTLFHYYEISSLSSRTDLTLLYLARPPRRLAIRQVISKPTKFVAACSEDDIYIYMKRTDKVSSVTVTTAIRNFRSIDNNFISKTELNVFT